MVLISEPVKVVLSNEQLKIFDQFAPFSVFGQFDVRLKEAFRYHGVWFFEQSTFLTF